MSQTVGDYLLERLSIWGVRRIYGYPGDGINGLMGAFTRSSNGQRPEFVQVRHEEMAAFMACGPAKLTRQPRGGMAPPRPGAGPPFDGLYDAQLDHPPPGGDVRPQGPGGRGGDHQHGIELQ